MSDWGGLLEGVALIAVSLFMLMAPKTVEKINFVLPFVRLGGPFGTFFGAVFLVIGLIILAVWLVRNSL